MRNSLKKYRVCYFKDVAQDIPRIELQFIVVTHLLPDRPELLDAIREIAPIVLIVAIPYSTDQDTFDSLEKNYTILAPHLEQLNNPHWLYDHVLPKINCDIPTIILEIGGYFAPVIHKLNNALGNKLMGIVEDTETGHRQYQKLSSLTCPVISVARSSLKETEDFLVGNSCLFSTERLIRDVGFLIDGKQALILGFGKVGCGLAHALLRRVCRVYVYDTNPIRRVLALSEGFQIPDRHLAIKDADLIFGATGNYSLASRDFEHIKKGALLISCSSKQIEFDLSYLNAHYKKVELFKNYTKYSKGDHYFYLLAQGTPINFLDNAVIGPVLALVQAEIIFAVKTIIELQGKVGIYEVSENERCKLAEKWLHHFTNQASGTYHNG